MVLTVTKCIVDVDRGPKKGGSNGKKNAWKKATTFSTRNPRTLWGRQSEQVPGTDSCLVYFRFYVLPNRAQLSDEQGNEEGNNGGEDEGTWESTEVGQPEGARKNCHKHLDIPEDETRLQFVVLKYLLVCQVEGQGNLTE